MKCQKLLCCGEIIENKVDTTGLVPLVTTQPGQRDEHRKEKQQTDDVLSFGFAMFIETDSYSIALELIIVTELLCAQDPTESPEC